MYFRINAGSFCYLLLMMFFIGTIQSCKKSDKELPTEKEEPSIMVVNSFKIEKTNNPTLQEDIVFEVKGDTIFGKLSKYHTVLIPSFVTTVSKVRINTTDQISGTTAVNFKNAVTYSLFDDKGQKHDYFVKITWNDSLPHISINTEGNAAITSKDNYLNAVVTIDGHNIYPDYTGNTQIKGRGNSTWSYPKKPYRLKLNSKASLLGLSAEKDWVLLANYLDETHLLNSIAFHLGKKFNVPYTNTGIPVELTINGQYQGLYLFTEQVEVEDNRVNVGDDGLLLELDSYYDEDYKFKSTYFQLPVMVKDPELDNASQLTPIKDQFQAMEDLIGAASFPNNDYMNYIDTSSLIGYLMTFMITDNEELNHPKSVYMNKAPGGKFVMGPIWDFDWAYGYEGSQKHFTYYDRFFWLGGNAKPGTKFFSKFLTDPKITARLKQRWAAFVSANDLSAFVDDLVYKIEGARNRDYSLWKRGANNYHTDIAALKTWLSNRVNYLTTYINGLP